MQLAKQKLFGVYKYIFLIMTRRKSILGTASNIFWNLIVPVNPEQCGADPRGMILLICWLPLIALIRYICRKCCATYKIMDSIAFHSATMFWLDWSSNDNNNNDNNPQIDVIHWGPEFCGFSRCVNSVHFQIFCLSIIIWIENRNRTDKQQNLWIPISEKLIIHILAMCHKGGFLSLSDYKRSR